MGRKNKGGKELAQTKDQTPLLPLSGTRKVVRTPTNPFEAAGTVEVFVPKEIIARRIQHIFAGPNKGRKADHYLVVWEDYPLEKDYTWEPIENLYGHEDLAQTYEQWLKTENERLDSQEAERKTARKMTAQKVQDVAADQFRKNDKFTKKAKGTDNTSRQTLHQEVEQDEAEAAADGDDNGCDDEVSTGSEGVSEGVGEKRVLPRTLSCHPKPASPTGCWSLACVLPELQSCGISSRGGSRTLMIMFEGFCASGQCWTLASRRSKTQHPSSLRACWIWTQCFSSNFWPGGYLRSRRLPVLL